MDESALQFPEQIEEYLTSLQQQIDALRSGNEKLTDRVRRLEAEREKLRSQLPRRRRSGFGASSQQKPVDRSIVIPGMGTIPDLALPDGPVSRPDLRVAAVLDEFSRAAFRYEFDLVDVPAHGWEEVLEANPPRLLLVESAYRGHDGSWAGRVARFGEPSSHLAAVVAWCRSRRIPTVFWNKEDPINFDWFISSARLFDWVFTVDSNMLDRYRRMLGHSRVDVLQFAAQPVIHHPPADESVRVGTVAFAGSYYAAKHPERRRQMEMLLSPALEFGLHIFDRMDRQDDPRFAWPEEYRDHIVGSLTYPQTLEAYRRYRVFINVNTVVDSPTMCARRIYELLACGTRVVSGPGKALEGVPVDVATDEDGVREALRSGLPRAQEGQDWLDAGNLVSHRVAKILELVLT